MNSVICLSKLIMPVVRGINRQTQHLNIANIQYFRLSVVFRAQLISFSVA